MNSPWGATLPIPSAAKEPPLPLSVTANAEEPPWGVVFIDESRQQYAVVYRSGSTLVTLGFWSNPTIHNSVAIVEPTNRFYQKPSTFLLAKYTPETIKGTADPAGITLSELHSTLTKHPGILEAFPEDKMMAAFMQWYNPKSHGQSLDLLDVVTQHSRAAALKRLRHDMELRTQFHAWYTPTYSKQAPPSRPWGAMTSSMAVVYVSNGDLYIEGGTSELTNGTQLLSRSDRHWGLPSSILLEPNNSGANLPRWYRDRDALRAAFPGDHKLEAFFKWYKPERYVPTDDLRENAVVKREIIRAFNVFYHPESPLQPAAPESVVEPWGVVFIDESKQQYAVVYRSGSTLVTLGFWSNPTIHNSVAIVEPTNHFYRKPSTFLLAKYEPEYQASIQWHLQDTSNLTPDSVFESVGHTLAELHFTLTTHPGILEAFPEDRMLAAFVKWYDHDTHARSLGVFDVITQYSRAATLKRVLHDMELRNQFHEWYIPRYSKQAPPSKPWGVITASLRVVYVSNGDLYVEGDRTYPSHIANGTKILQRSDRHWGLPSSILLAPMGPSLCYADLPRWYRDRDALRAAFPGDHKLEAFFKWYKPELYVPTDHIRQDAVLKRKIISAFNVFYHPKVPSLFQLAARKVTPKDRKELHATSGLQITSAFEKARTQSNMGQNWWD